MKFKTSMLRSSLCNYSNAYILAEGSIVAIITAAQGQANNAAIKKVIFENCRINNTQVDDACIYDEVYNLIEYSDNYWKIWRQCLRDQLVVNNNGEAIDFTVAIPSLILLKLKSKNNRSKRQQWHNKYWNDGTIKTSKKFLKKSWNIFNFFEINLDLSWSEKCVIVASDVENEGAKFSITDTELYAVTCSFKFINSR